MVFIQSVVNNYTAYSLPESKVHNYTLTQTNPSRIPKRIFRQQQENVFTLSVQTYSVPKISLSVCQNW